jgi:4'-phosphopantetheinyl transferase
VRREILSSYLGVAPAQLRFRAGEHGKPALADPPVPLRFNASASGGLGLLGVSAAGEVGVDIEVIRRELDWRPLAADCFTRAESMALLSLARHAGRNAFFRCWTRKEAYVKARGEGLSLPLDGFEVSLDRAGGAERVGAWWVREVDPAPGYAAAVAGDGDPPRLTCRRWGR